MNAFAHFYSTAGRLSIVRFALVALVVVALLYGLDIVDWQWGLVANIAAGAMGGGACGKLLVSAIRRLKDAGFSIRYAAWLALALGAVTLFTFVTFLISDPLWANDVLTVLGYVVPGSAVVAMLWPPKPESSSTSNHRRWAGPVIGLVSIATGAVVAGFLAWLSIGMDANNRARAEQEIHQHLGEQP